MLFISMAKPKVGAKATQQEIIARRAQWKFPPGVRVVAEYWPIGGEYSVITITEADNIAPAIQSIGPWNDVFDFTITPAVTAEEGLKLFQQMMKG